MKAFTVPKPKDLPVVREDSDFIVINNGNNCRLALRKPLSERWIENRTGDGKLISLTLKMKGVNDA